MKEFIVKVQLNKSSAEETRKCVIHNQDRSVQMESHATFDIVQMMGGHLTRFFWVCLESNGELTFSTNAPDQDW